MNDQNLQHLIESISQSARKASLELTTLTSEKKNQFLYDLADALEANIEGILEANAVDIDNAKSMDLSPPMIERLQFTKDRINQMAVGVRQVAELSNPVGETIEQMNPPRGFDLRKIRVPIGVIGIIYESRPNVTVDCAILCLKSGNASILRGGKEAFNSNTYLIKIIQSCLTKNNINPNAVQLIPTTDRDALKELLKHDQYVHCIIPRGGEGLIRFTVENSRIPVIKHYTGVCSVYIDGVHDYEKAESITLNSKCQRPSVCNAAENLLIHQDALSSLPRLAQALHEDGVELRVDSSAKAALTGTGIPMIDAQDQDFGEEYNDLIISIAVVPNMKAAIEIINTRGSAHTDTIVTEDAQNAQDFLKEVDSSTVLHNASTRFSDGFEFGLGAEIGISTDRLHARGPMGLNELCTYKYIVHGKGEIKD